MWGLALHFMDAYRQLFRLISIDGFYNRIGLLEKWFRLFVVRVFLLAVVLPDYFSPITINFSS
jgi:hypothetical protein